MLGVSTAITKLMFVLWSDVWSNILLYRRNEHDTFRNVFTLTPPFCCTKWDWSSIAGQGFLATLLCWHLCPWVQTMPPVYYWCKDNDGSSSLARQWLTNCLSVYSRTLTLQLPSSLVSRQCILRKNRATWLACDGHTVSWLFLFYFSF